jgi:hypothetical protein
MGKALVGQVKFCVVQLEYSSDEIKVVARGCKMTDHRTLTPLKVIIVVVITHKFLKLSHSEIRRVPSGDTHQ